MVYEKMVSFGIGGGPWVRQLAAAFERLIYECLRL